jgi:urease accessory protein
VAEGARFEWLPLETILYPDTLAENRMRFELAPGAEMMGWDVLALGLPASNQPYDRGRYTQSIELPGVWLERGRIDGHDTRLLRSPLGWAGHTVLATMWFAAGGALTSARRDTLLDAAREAVSASPLRTTAGCTAPHGEVVVLRALAHRVEPAMQLLTEVWKRWRQTAWSRALPTSQRPAPAPRCATPFRGRSTRRASSRAAAAHAARRSRSTSRPRLNGRPFRPPA